MSWAEAKKINSDMGKPLDVRMDETQAQIEERLDALEAQAGKLAGADGKMYIPVMKPYVEQVNQESIALNGKITSMVYAHGRIYAATSTGYLYMLDPQYLTVLAQKTFTSSSMSNMIIGRNGDIYLNFNNSNPLRRLDKDTLEPISATGSNVDGQNTNSLFQLPDGKIFSLFSYDRGRFFDENSLETVGEDIILEANIYDFAVDENYIYYVSNSAQVKRYNHDFSSAGSLYLPNITDNRIYNVLIADGILIIFHYRRFAAIDIETFTLLGTIYLDGTYISTSTTIKNVMVSAPSGDIFKISLADNEGSGGYVICINNKLEIQGLVRTFQAVGGSIPEYLGACCADENNVLYIGGKKDTNCKIRKVEFYRQMVGMRRA